MTDLVKRLRRIRISRDQKAALALIEELVSDDMPGWLYNHRDKIAGHFKRYAASALESLSAENAALKRRYDLTMASRLEWRRQAEEAQRENAVLLQQRNEAFERAAEVAEGEIDPEWPSDDLSSQARAIAAAIRNLSKES